MRRPYTSRLRATTGERRGYRVRRRRRSASAADQQGDLVGRTDAALSRPPRKYGPVYNAVVTILHERALREARRADQRTRGRRRAWPAARHPYGVKDLLATPDAPTTWAPNRIAASIRLRCNRRCEARGRRRGAARKVGDDRTGRRLGYNDADASFTGPDGRRGTRHFGPAVRRPDRALRRPRDSSGSRSAPKPRLYRVSVDGVRRDGLASDVRSREPARRDGALLDARQDRAIARSARDGEIILRTIAGADPSDADAADRPFSRRVAGRASPCSRTRPKAACRGGAQLPRVARTTRNVLRSRSERRSARSAVWTAVGRSSMPKAPRRFAI